MKKITKKNTFVKLYGKKIACLSLFILIVILVIIGAFAFCESYTKEFSLVLYFLCIIAGFSIITMIASLISLIITRVIALYHQLYIPLSEQELKEHDITSVKEYNLFLRKWMKGCVKNENVGRLIFKSAFVFLLNKSEQMSYISGYETLNGKKTKMNYDCILKEINEYKFDYIINDKRDLLDEVYERSGETDTVWIFKDNLLYYPMDDVYVRTVKNFWLSFIATAVSSFLVLTLILG